MHLKMLLIMGSIKVENTIIFILFPRLFPDNCAELELQTMARANAVKMRARAHQTLITASRLKMKKLKGRE
jgi:hypothetical protein